MKFVADTAAPPTNLLTDVKQDEDLLPQGSMVAGATLVLTPTIAAANAAAASFAALMIKLDYLSSEDLDAVRRAYRFADEAHLGQLRKNGEPYITHPIAVASLCAQWRLDADTLMAALLHDAMEDCGISKAELIERFGAPVADLVDGLTKLEKLEFSTREENQAESFRKMLLAMSRDVRVILIKLADRSHNMQTMGDMPRSKWARISQETLDIYVPIAHRLGLNATYRQLQDLAFKHLWPWRYEVLTKAVTKARGRRRDLIERVQTELMGLFQAQNLQVELSGREKTLYSIFRKMKDKRLSFANVTDIYGFRVVVPQVIACYTALGVLHQHFKPVPGKFKDYIAIPKHNGYQSLHTTLVGPANINIEFQMRTHAMHAVAESGIAAHWLYKTSSDTHGIQPDRLASQWLQSLLDIQSETRDASEFWEHVKVDLYPEDVYVFTPKGKILSLPRGATLLDFAYAIHSNVGEHAVGGLINQEDASLRSVLKNGDVVQVQTDPAAQPEPAWLGFVRTGRARSKIRHYLKALAQQDAARLGEQLFSLALRAEGMQELAQDHPHTGAIWDKLLRFSGNKQRVDLMQDIGLGKRIAGIVAKRMVVIMAEYGELADPVLISQARYLAHESGHHSGVVIDGSDSASVQFANCCGPVPGDAIMGYLGKGEGLAIHRPECAVAQKLLHKDSERFIEVDWSEEPVRRFTTGMRVEVTNGQGVLAQVAAALAKADVDITHIDMAPGHTQGTAELRFTLEVRDLAHLEQATQQMKRLGAVLAIKRALQSA